MSKLRQLWPSLKRLLNYGLLHKASLIQAVILLWVASAAEVSGPLLISYFIDHIVAVGDFPLSKVAGWVAAYLSLQILAAFFYYSQSILFNRAAIEVVKKLRSEVMAAAMQQPLRVFDTQPVGQLISRISNDTEAVRDLYVTVVSTVLRSAALISAMLIAMFSLEWRMALIAILIFPMVLLLMLIYNYFSTPVVRQLRSLLADINNGFNETINGMKVIQQFRQQSRFGQKIAAANQSHYQRRMKMLQLEGILLRPMLSLLFAMILCGLLLLFGVSPENSIGVGVLYAFISYLGRLNEPLIELTSQISILQQSIVAGERIFELMDAPQQSYGELCVPLTSGHIEISDLSFAYNQGAAILHHVSLSIPDKSFIALVGHTGSGKSTLAHLLMGYYPVRKGAISLDGKDIMDLSYCSLRQGIAIVQQDPTILAESIYSNIALDRNIDEQIIWRVLETVQLADWVKGLPEGLQTYLGEEGDILSIGQKQLLALARLLVDPPAILILDEATANIDSGTEQAIQKVLQVVCQKATLIVIAHRMSTIAEADNIVVLHHGKVMEQGTHQQLLAREGRYYQMHRLQLVASQLENYAIQESSMPTISL